MALPIAERPIGPREGRVLPAFGIIGWAWISRNPAATIAPILLPFIFLTFLKFISPQGLFPLEILGAMLFTTQNIGSWVLGDSASWRIEAGLQDLFVASPMGKVRYLLGVAVSNLIPAAPALVVLAGLFYFEGPTVAWYAWPVVTGVILVLWLLFSSIGIAISSRLTSQREIWPVGNLLFTLLGMLAPLYYPLSYLPQSWQTVSRFLPTTYAALLVQGVTGLEPASTISLLSDGLLLVVLAVVGVAIALRSYRWRET